MTPNIELRKTDEWKYRYTERLSLLCDAAVSGEGCAAEGVKTGTRIAAAGRGR